MNRSCGRVIRKGRIEKHWTTIQRESRIQEPRNRERREYLKIPHCGQRKVIRRYQGPEYNVFMCTICGKTSKRDVTYRLSPFMQKHFKIKHFVDWIFQSCGW